MEMVSEPWRRAICVGMVSGGNFQMKRGSIKRRTMPKVVDKGKAAGTRSKEPWECKAYRDYVKEQPCIVCGWWNVDAHHIRETLDRTMGRRISVRHLT